MLQSVQYLRQDRIRKMMAAIKALKITVQLQKIADVWPLAKMAANYKKMRLTGKMAFLGRLQKWSL